MHSPTKEELLNLKYFVIEEDDNLRQSSSSKIDNFDIRVYDRYINHEVIGAMHRNHFQDVAKHIATYEAFKVGQRVALYSKSDKVKNSVLCPVADIEIKKNYENEYAVIKDSSKIDQPYYFHILRQKFINLYFCYMIRLKIYFDYKKNRSYHEQMNVDLSTPFERVSRIRHRFAIELAHAYLVVLTEILWRMLPKLPIEQNPEQNKNVHEASKDYIKSLGLSATVLGGKRARSEDDSHSHSLLHPIKKRLDFGHRAQVYSRGSSRSLTQRQTLLYMNRLLTQLYTRVYRSQF